MSERALDEVDRKLLGLLRKDARKPIVALAKAVGLSRSAVQGRLARLEDEGTIRGYTVRLGAASGAAVKAILLVCIETRPCASVISRFRDWPGVTACWSVAGPTIDAVLLVEAGSTDELGRVRARIAEVPGVSSITTAPILSTIVEAV